MHFPRVRFTVRRMVAVAIVAILFSITSGLSAILIWGSHCCWPPAYLRTHRGASARPPFSFALERPLASRLRNDIAPDPPEPE